MIAIQDISWLIGWLHNKISNLENLSSPLPPLFQALLMFWKGILWELKDQKKLVQSLCHLCISVSFSSIGKNLKRKRNPGRTKALVSCSWSGHDKRDSKTGSKLTFFKSPRSTGKLTPRYHLGPFIPSTFWQQSLLSLLKIYRVDLWFGKLNLQTWESWKITKNSLHCREGGWDWS